MHYGKSSFSTVWRRVYSLLGITLMAGSVLLSVKTYQAYTAGSAQRTHEWLTDYAKAKAAAITQQKPLFVDIGAPFCSICKAIDATLFTQENVLAALKESTIPVKIDGSDTQNQELLSQYQVFGFPTILLIDPTNGAIIKKWGPELYGIESQKFINELAAHANPEKIPKNISDYQTARKETELIGLVQ